MFSTTTLRALYTRTLPNPPQPPALPEQPEPMACPNSVEQGNSSPSGPSKHSPPTAGPSSSAQPRRHWHSHSHSGARGGAGAVDKEMADEIVRRAIALPRDPKPLVERFLKRGASHSADLSTVRMEPCGRCGECVVLVVWKGSEGRAVGELHSKTHGSYGYPIDKDWYEEHRVPPNVNPKWLGPLPNKEDRTSTVLYRKVLWEGVDDDSRDDESVYTDESVYSGDRDEPAPEEDFVVPGRNLGLSQEQRLGLQRELEWEMQIELQEDMEQDSISTTSEETPRNPKRYSRTPYPELASSSDEEDEDEDEENGEARRTETDTADNASNLALVKTHARDNAEATNDAQDEITTVSSQSLHLVKRNDSSVKGKKKSVKSRIKVRLAVIKVAAKGLKNLMKPKRRCGKARQRSS